MSTRDNVIIKHVHGVPVRIQNKIYIQLHCIEYEKLLEQAHHFGISVAQMIRLMSAPCQKCGHDKVEICLPAMTTKTEKRGFTMIKKWETNENDH